MSIRRLLNLLRKSPEQQPARHPLAEARRVRSALEKERFAAKRHREIRAALKKMGVR